MKFVADLHLHSKYSRATSRNMDLEHLDRFARLKGIKVMGTGDFTHPEWFQELKEKLEPAEAGLFKLKNPLPDQEQGGETRFMLTTEVSCIYSKGNRVRKIHHIIFAPSFEVVEKINVPLGWIGNLAADGRPIFGADSQEIIKIVLAADENCLLIPAHLWTPWFSLFGSRSGFDSIEECFGGYSKYIYAGETGLSSDPAMNWRLSALDKIALISNSDSHSPAKIGREANVFDTELSYQGIVGAIKTRDPQKFLSTIEFFPQEGKYHYDGHRSCGVSLSPSETKQYNGLCPSCGRSLTIGVLSRVEELADRPEGFKPEGAVPFKSLVPLEEIIADAMGQNVGTKAVVAEYDKLIGQLGSELKILLEARREELERVSLPEVAEGVIRVREGKIQVEPGYDGVYGKISIFSDKEQKTPSSQSTLF